MPTPKIEDNELELDVQAYYDHGGNRSEAARARGLKRQTYTDRLNMAQKRLGITLGKAADGRVHAEEILEHKLPKKGYVKRYVLTSAQNNTHTHPGLNNLLALVDYWDRLPNAECELMVGTFSYQIAAYGPKAVKRGTYNHAKAIEPLKYAAEIEDYIVDTMNALAPGLIWCGNMNILPTTKWPLTSFDSYNGRSSNIVPHSTISMESVASMADEATKFNYSTGTITQRNYIQKRAGQLAEQRHDYGALVVEVDHEGSWWVRQLYIDHEDNICDLGIKVKSGIVYTDVRAEAINWGDAHSSEMDLWVRELGWGEGGLLDEQKPKYQFMNDLFSMRSRSHHESKNFHRTYQKHIDEEDSVEGEVQVTADFLSAAERDWCEIVVVPSNHDRHLMRWLNEEDPRKDPLNAKYFHLLQYRVLDAMDEGDKDFNVLEWALNHAGCPEGIRFLSEDESFVICKTRKFDGVECGLHGDLSPNGARGSTLGLTKLGRAVNKGHDHSAAIRGGVFGAATCAIRLPYMKGPSSHSISHIVTFENGMRTIVTMWAGKSHA